MYSNRHHIKLYRKNHSFFRREIGVYFNADAKTVCEHSIPTTCLPYQSYLFTKKYIFSAFHESYQDFGLWREYVYINVCVCVCATATGNMGCCAMGGKVLYCICGI